MELNCCGMVGMVENNEIYVGLRNQNETILATYIPDCPCFVDLVVCMDGMPGTPL